MNPDEFSRDIRKKAQELKIYSETRFPSKAGNVALRFVNGNFRAQGFKGSTFQPWKPNRKGTTTLVKTGKLRAANYFTTQIGQFTLKNHMKYAKIHNEGFKGTISVKAHSRNKYSKTRVGNRTMTMKTGEKAIRSHSRKINLPQRQFIPTVANPSPVLNNAILRMMDKDIQNIMK